MKQYLQNYVGYKLSDEEMKKIPYPMAELTSHITFKTFQAGAVLSTALGALKAVSKAETRNVTGIQNTIARFGKRGLIIGFVAGPIMTQMFVNGKGVDQDGLYDRCYRLRYNRNQVRVDRAGDAGLVLGVGSCYLAGSSLWLGATLGTTCGVIAGAVMNSKIQDKHTV